MFTWEISSHPRRDLAQESWPSSHVNENKFVRDLTGRRDLGKKGQLLEGLTRFHVNTTSGSHIPMFHMLSPDYGTP